MKDEIIHCKTPIHNRLVSIKFLEVKHFSKDIARLRRVVGKESDNRCAYYVQCRFKNNVKVETQERINFTHQFSN